MAVFSNLEGTMKKSFIVGKGGAKLVYINGSLKLMNYNESDLLPISVAQPTDDTHAVNLAYFNANKGSETGNGTILHGTVDPDETLGSDENVYFKLDSTSILGIYFKDGGIWKPYSAAPTIDSDYVTTYVVQPSDWVNNGSNYSYTLLSTVHNRGTDFAVQIQNSTGTITSPSTTIDSSGDITVNSNILPTEEYEILIIGATNLTTPYSKKIDKAEWSSVSSHYEMVIPASTHLQASGPLFITVYQNTVDGITSAAPYSVVGLETSIDSSGNVTLQSNIIFSGKIVISGK